MEKRYHRLGALLLALTSVVHARKRPRFSAPSPSAENEVPSKGTYATSALKAYAVTTEITAHAPGTKASPGAVLARPARATPPASPAPYLAICQRNLDSDDAPGSGIPDSADSALGAADDDLVQLTLIIGPTGQASGTVSLSLPAGVQAYDANGTRLTPSDLQVNLAAPAGKLAALKTQSVNIFVEALATFTSGSVQLTHNGTSDSVLLLPFEIAVDANRDGTIKFAGNFDSEEAQGKPYDKTEQAKPFRFWVNNDDDETDGSENVNVGTPDNQYAFIEGKRDLEDFTRLHIHVGGLHQAIVSGAIQIGLEWKNVTGTPAVWVHRAASASGSDGYLKDETQAGNQIAGVYGVALGKAAHDAPFKIDKAALQSLSASNPNAFFLFDGAAEGKGELVITLWKGSEKIGDGPGVSLDLLDVKKMYVRAKGTPENGVDAPVESYFSQPNPPPTGYVDDPNGHPFQEPHNEDDSLVVLVHGIHAPFTDVADAYKGNIVAAEIVFKRLWHQGFKGRFAFYKWPALNPAGFGSTGFEFNGSEYRAWKYGRGLAEFVNSINKSSKNLFSHSQGNIVCGAALTDYGLSVDNYVLTQAAVPAGCYDTSGGQNDPASINGYARFWNREATKPTPDFSSDLGYRGYLQTLAVSGNVRNFYNAVDYALYTGTSLFGLLETHWEANQDSYKPDGSLSNGNFYTYVSGNPAGQRCQLVDSLFVGRFVINPHESMSMVARPRSKAVGARDGVGGSIDTGLNLESFTSTSGDQVFTRSSDDHGAQVGRRIQEVWGYYTELGRTFGVIPLPE